MVAMANLDCGLSDLIIERIRAVFIHFAWINKVILYGSRAKGTYRAGSDIDLTICSDAENMSDYDLLKALSKVLTELDDLNLPYTFDVSIHNQLTNVDLIDHIERVGKVFYARADLSD